MEPMTDKIDTVTLDIPLLLRMLEYAKEDAKTDMDLHVVTDRMIALSKRTDVLTMKQYNQIVSGVSGTGKQSAVEESSVKLTKLYNKHVKS